MGDTYSKRELIDIIAKANAATYAKTENNTKTLSDQEIAVVVTRILGRARKRIDPCTKEEMLDMVEYDLMRYGLYEVASTFIRMRVKDELEND